MIVQWVPNYCDNDVKIYYRDRVVDLEVASKLKVGLHFSGVVYVLNIYNLML